MKTFSKIFAISICILAYNTIAFSYPSGSPGGYSGAPSDGKTCTGCHAHAGTNALVAGWITSDIPAEGYTPETTYNITLNISASSKKGFELSPQNASGTLVGTLISGTGSKLVNSNKSITQSTGKSTNPAQWTFQWKAPVAGTGDFSFYGVYAIGTSDVKTGKLDIKENTSLGVNYVEINKSINIYPNPSSGKINIKAGIFNGTAFKVTIFNAKGESVVSEFYNNINSDLSFDLSKQSKGVYFIEISDGKNIYRKECVIE